MKTKEEIIEFIERLEAKDKEHWDKLDKYHYTDFPETEDEDCWSYTLEGMEFYSHHEQFDLPPIKTILEWVMD